MDGFLAINEKIPEAAVGYEENFIKNLYPENGLEIIPPIYYGNWCKRENFTAIQDIIIAKKI